MGEQHKADGRGTLASQRGRNRYRKQCKLRDQLADLLQQTKRHAHLAAKVRACHRVFGGWKCAHGHRVAKPKASCDCRLCAFEARERSMRMQKKFAELIRSKRRAKYMVLHEASRADLAAGIEHLWASWGRLRKLPIWAPVKGALVALEVTYNAKQGTWHPHLNVLLDCPDWVNRRILGDAWREATEDQRTHTPRIEPVDSGTPRELLKYITKLSDLIGYNDPALIEEFLDATRRVRFVRTYGTFYGVGADTEAEETCTCPDCGGQLYLFAHRLYLEQVELDRGGVWRPLVSAIPQSAGGSAAAAGSPAINTRAKRIVSYGTSVEALKKLVPGEISNTAVRRIANTSPSSQV